MSVATGAVPQLGQSLQDTSEDRRIFTKIGRRILPILILAYIANFLDRTNVSFAALTMNKEIGLTAEQFGFGAGVLFLGYCLFELPSNIALYRFGARIWLSRIMITWGLISMGMIFATGPYSYYALRFVLGVAEAGFFPGAAFYLAQWFPAEYRTRIYALFLLGIPISSMIGGPISGLLLEMHGFAGLAGWKWLFILEGAPAVLLGILILIVLVDRPEQASWLTAEEKAHVRARLQGEKKERERHDLLSALKDPRVLLIAVTQFSYTVGSYGVSLFLPLILKAQNFSNVTVGFLSAIPYVLACIGMVLWAIVVDRTGQKILNLALMCFVSALGLVLAIATGSFLISFIGLIVVVIGTNAARGVLWTIPTRFLSGIGAAGGLALINSVGTFGGFVGPYTMGYFREATGSFNAGLLALSGFLFVSVILALTMKLVIRNE